MRSGFGFREDISHPKFNWRPGLLLPPYTFGVAQAQGLTGRDKIWEGKQGPSDGLSVVSFRATGRLLR
jgi:hypothetical protein